LINRTIIQQILAQYSILRNYCDTQWNSTFAANSSSMQCKKGCSRCCILQSVNILEAYLIYRQLKNDHLNIRTLQSDEDCCAFLSPSGECTIYISRPLLCRTHGLLLKSVEFTDTIARSCDLNFTDTISHSTHTTIDIDTITVNAEKLCCAFALAAGDLHLSSIRIRLEDIRSGSIPEPLQELFQQ
jgi:Fe-S-cluster containining protein